MTPTAPRPSRLSRAKRRAAVVTSAALLAAGGTALTVAAPGLEAPPAPSDAPNVEAALAHAAPDSTPAVPIVPVGDVRLGNEGLEAPEPEAGDPVPGGEASYYGRELAGNPTASGEPFDPSDLTAAHRTLPLGTRVRVTHAGTGESVVVRINDRGPFHGDRVIDVSRAAADAIGLTQSGTAEVEIETLPPTRGARG